MWIGEREEVKVATPGGFLGKREGGKMADKPPRNLKEKELEVKKGRKTGEEQRRGEGVMVGEIEGRRKGGG